MLDLIEPPAEGLRCLRSIRRVFGEDLIEEVRERFRNVELCERGSGVVQDSADDCRLVVCCGRSEGCSPEQHFVEGDPELVDVAATVEGFVVEDLWRRVRQSSNDRLGCGHLALTNEAGDSEVGEFRSAAIEEDVCWLHITVQHSAAVSNVEGGADLHADLDHVGPMEGLTTAKTVAHRAANDVFEHRVVHVVFVDFAAVEDRNDVGVPGQGTHRCPLSFEPLEIVGVGGVVVQYFDRNLVVVQVVGCEVNRCETTAAKTFADRVPRDCGLCHSRVLPIAAPLRKASLTRLRRLSVSIIGGCAPHAFRGDLRRLDVLVDRDPRWLA